MRLRFVCKWSSVAAPAKIKHSFVSSLGCRESPPTEIQFVAPPLELPIPGTIGKSNSKSPNTATGVRNLLTRSRSFINQIKKL